MNKLFSFIADLFFPNRCPVCGDFIVWNSLLCDNCGLKLTPFPDDICPKCGKVNCICSSGPEYDRAFVCFYYENAAKDGILSLKDGSREFGVYLGRLLGEKIYGDSLDADAVVPVPMSAESKRKRGYNQAEVIAREIAAINDLPVYKNLILKNSSSVQHTLNKAEREKNTSAFYSGKAKIINSKIILCDDVITTGSTLNKCAALLKEMGAAEVYAAVGTTTKLKKDE